MQIVPMTALVGLFAAVTTVAMVSPDRSNDGPTISMTPTALGCDITVRAHNKAGANVTIDLEDSEAKIKNGLWKKFNQGGNWIVNTGGEHESQVVSLDLGCDIRRQYKFLMRSGSNEKYIYFPGEDDFTTSTSLGLANVGRHF